MVSDHIKSFARHSGHRITAVSHLGVLPEAFDFSQFDAVVTHYSLFLASDGYISPRSRERLRAFDGVKAMFIHDEYRSVERTIEAMHMVGMDLVFTCVPPEEIVKVYSPLRLPRTRFVNVLTGYVPQRLLHRTVPSYRERPIDVGYRGRVYPAWHGACGLERVTIAERFAADASYYDLATDISVREADRLYGPPWDDFLARSKATLGTESGCSIIDFTGEIEARVLAHCEREPDAGYEVLRDLYFADLEDTINLRQISARCFEAIAARSLLILYEGQYSGILQPWRHFVPLAKDHRNMKEVVAVLRDPRWAETIIERVYQEILLNPKYSECTLIRRFDYELAATKAAKPPWLPRPGIVHIRSQAADHVPVPRADDTLPAMVPAPSARRLAAFSGTVRQQARELRLKAVRTACLVVKPTLAALLKLWHILRHALVLAVKWLLWVLLPSEKAASVWARVKRMNRSAAIADDVG